MISNAGRSFRRTHFYHVWYIFIGTSFTMRTSFFILFHGYLVDMIRQLGLLVQVLPIFLDNPPPGG